MTRYRVQPVDAVRWLGQDHPWLEHVNRSSRRDAIYRPERYEGSCSATVPPGCGLVVINDLPRIVQIGDWMVGEAGEPDPTDVIPDDVFRSLYSPAENEDSARLSWLERNTHVTSEVRNLAAAELGADVVDGWEGDGEGEDEGEDDEAEGQPPMTLREMIDGLMEAEKRAE